MNGRISSGLCWLGITLVSAGCISGCSSSNRPEGMPTLHPVTLTILQDGKPLEGASVSLIPQDAANIRWACGGSSDAEGKVVVKTLGQYDGAAEGIYVATVTKSIVEGPPPEDSPSAVNTQKTFSVVDPKFQTPENSGLTVTVASGANNPDPLDVGAPVKIAPPDL